MTVKRLSGYSGSSSAHPIMQKKTFTYITDQRHGCGVSAAINHFNEAVLSNISQFSHQLQSHGWTFHICSVWIINAPPVLHDGGLGLDVRGDAAHVGHEVSGGLLLLLLGVHNLTPAQGQSQQPQQEAVGAAHHGQHVHPADVTRAQQEVISLRYLGSMRRRSLRALWPWHDKRDTFWQHSI